MPGRGNIRYHALWVRLLCCLAVAIGVANAVYFGALGPVETALRELLLYSEAHRFVRISRAREILLLLGICVLPAIPRIERPLAMVVFGALLLAGYAGAVFAVLTSSPVALPVASPLLGLLGCTAVLETMAWSEERSDRRSLEALEQARQQFTDMLVHDLRKRMTSILLSFSLLEKRGGAPADAASRDLLTTIRASAERTLMLISNLLDIRRLQEGRLALHREDSSLRRLIDEAIAEHRAAFELLGVTVRVADGEDAHASVDRSLFLRVLANLLWNALQHAPAGSEVAVASARTPEGDVEIRIANRGDPISTGAVQALFRPFSSPPAGSPPPAPDSAGLGLAFCKLALEAHHGTIAIESPWAPNADGVCVRLRLPARA